MKQLAWKAWTSLTCGLLFVGVSAGCGGAAATNARSTPTPSPFVSLDRQAAGGTCADGGACAIGEMGPGGGTVFYDAGAEQSWGRYMEAAPAGWNTEGTGTRKEVWCDQNIETIIAVSESIGSGFNNTSAMVAACSSGAANKAQTYAGGGKTDWFLPSIAELKELWNQREKIGIDGSCYYWSSSMGTRSWPFSLSFQNGSRSSLPRDEEECVRPVRTI